jgi:hypothetical protein
MKLCALFFVLFAMALTISGFAQIPNPGFEDWVTDGDGNYNPAGWTTSNFNPIVNVVPTSPGYSGSYAMTVKTVDVGVVFPGVAYVETAYNFSQRPSHFYAYVKSNIVPGDQGLIMIALMKGDSAVAALDSCTFKVDTTITQYKYIVFPIAYLNNLIPDSLIVMVASGLLGGHVGTELTVDDIGFLYGSTDVLQNENLPGQFELNQNYPNPFNPATKIRYSVPQSSLVQIKVFDVLGNELETLVNEEKPAGTYELNWNAANLPSGVYFYQISAGDFVQTKKMILLR